MTTRELILMVGYPRSGKTTRAKKLYHELTDLGLMVAIFNRDAYHHAMHGKRYYSFYNLIITRAIYDSTRAAFWYGYDVVIIDACHTERKYCRAWEEIARAGEWRLTYEVLDTSVEECIRRAGDDEYIVEVIKKQAEAADFWEMGQ